MKKIFNTLIATIFMLLSGMSVSHAECIEDFGDAFLAVFTGGASYAICQITETVELLLRLVQSTASSIDRIANDTINAAMRIVNESVNSVSNNMNSLMQQFSSITRSAGSIKRNAIRVAEEREERQRQQLLRTTSGVESNASAIDARVLDRSVRTLPPVKSTKHKINEASSKTGKVSKTQKTSKATVSAAPITATARAARINYASVVEVQRAMDDAVNKLSGMQREVVNEPLRHIESSLQLATNTASRHMGSALRMAEVSIKGPLQELENFLSDLLSDPASIFDPSASIRASIERTHNAMLGATEEMHGMILNEPLAMIGDLDQHINRITGDLQKANKILDAMQVVERQGDKRSVDNLNLIVNGPRTYEVMRATAQLSTGSKNTKAENGKVVNNRLSISNVSMNSKYKFNASSNKKMNNLIAELNKGVNKIDRIKSSALPKNIEQRVKIEMSRLVENKSPSEVQAIKQQYKQQALNFSKNYPDEKINVNQNFEKKFDNLIRGAHKINNNSLAPKDRKSIKDR